MTDWSKNFRRTKRPGWMRTNDGEVVPLKRRLKGLDEFETPAFVGRMARIERRRKLTWYGMLSSAIVLGALIGLIVF